MSLYREEREREREIRIDAAIDYTLIRVKTNTKLTNFIK